MTFRSGAPTQAAELFGIRKTLRTVYPPVTDSPAAMSALLAAIDRACALRTEAALAAGVCSLVAGATPRVEASVPELRA